MNEPKKNKRRVWSLRHVVLGSALAGALFLVWFTDGYRQVPKHARSVLAGADTWTLYALDPHRSYQLKEERRNEPVPPLFHEFEILDQANISDPKAKKALIKGLAWSIESNLGAAALCFNPRHGISAETASGRADLVICFQCMRMHIYDESGSDVGSTGLGKRIPKEFERVFAEAGLKIAD